MAIWNWLYGEDMPLANTDINPATGLPMIGDCAGVDVGGNPFGVDLHQTGDNNSLSGLGTGFDMED